MQLIAEIYKAVMLLQMYLLGGKFRQDEKHSVLHI